ncbi:P-loop containing nucleoside triphosphate hydrolase protein [Annulohypoxylon maeteangense]|uniref:P-loop containing nucleoside triphosphate hydrolase protein n=1 Tax=Annulohypoxylon maeteangense TaxID=1927788 RepID=UPI002007BF15|nr:P-loop containing nucleoside triphosphate hydrolase protein [Annulohypoxylon maeteangense]KAI0888970.1 P-loop containing nucleoside triphosphate hydrolase protein [Annulohypoxylon maeteangense]
MTPPQPPPPTKHLIQMSGAPGSGKSTLSRRLRPSISGIIIDHDILRTNLLSSPHLPFDSAAKQAYLLQWDLASDIMSHQGLNVIVDSTCNYDEVVERGRALAAAHGYVYWYVECKVRDVAVLDKRLRARPAMASQRAAVDCPPVAAQGIGARVGEDARALFERWIESPCRPSGDDGHVIILDSTGSPEALCEQVLKKMGLST